MDSQIAQSSSDVDINFLTVSRFFKDREDLSNGVNLLPAEIITKIFDYVEPYELLKLSNVCHKWNVIIKQPHLWRKKYARKYKKEPKRFPWFVLFSMVTTDYYDVNPVIHGAADNTFKTWNDSIERFSSPVHGFTLATMQGCLPLHLKKISKCTSKTKIYINKMEMFNFGNNRLARLIVNAFKPIVYSVEWSSCSIVTHCANHPKLSEIIHNGRLSEYCKRYAVESAITKWSTSNWKQSPIIITDYSMLDRISFIHIISVNQSTIPQEDEDNLLEVIEYKPNILESSLPF